MEKRQPVVLAKAPLVDAMDAAKHTPPKFTGTTNLREVRALYVLSREPLSREELDKVAGASNGPAVIQRLREKGVCIDCVMEPAVDRDGVAIRVGVYYLRPQSWSEVEKFFHENPKLVKSAIQSFPAALGMYLF